MANHYFDICTSEKFENVTGKLINHKQEIMKPSKLDPGFIDSFKQILGSNKYSRYAHREDVFNMIWNLCNDSTNS